MSYYSDLIENVDDAGSVYNNADNMHQTSKFLYIQYLNQPGKKKKLKREFWGSGIVGSPIRNAKTGFLTDYVVGTKFEDLFFKVSMTSGLNRYDRAPATLFYDSPEQYEMHQDCILPVELKEKWVEKRVIAERF
jgi:hypothetical protein